MDSPWESQLKNWLFSSHNARSKILGKPNWLDDSRESTAPQFQPFVGWSFDLGNWWEKTWKISCRCIAIEIGVIMPHMADEWGKHEENAAFSTMGWLSPSIFRASVGHWCVIPLTITQWYKVFVVLGLHWPRTWNHEAAQEKTQGWRPHVWRDWGWSVNCARHQVPVCLALVVLVCQLCYLGARRVWFFFADWIAQGFSVMMCYGTTT